MSLTLSNNLMLLRKKTNIRKRKKTNIKKEAPLKLKTPDKNFKMPAEAVKSKMPGFIKPMLAVLVNKPFDREGWEYEVKWDGYRAVAYIMNNKVNLKSRNDKSFNDKFYPVTKALTDLSINVVLDGEIVVVDNNGISNFGALQNWRSEADGELYYYVFDVIWLNGYSLENVPLLTRKEVLKTLIPKSGIIKMSQSFHHSGIEFFESAKKLGLEGIMAKKSDSLYKPGDRTDEWLKIKANKRQEMVIGGFTKNEDTSKSFSSLLVGVYEKDNFTYKGKIGTGFSDKVQKDLLRLFKPLIIKKSPFEHTPDVNKASRFRPDPPHALATWLKPVLVCEVSFAEMTRDGVMRHPSFEGMREDKNAKNIIMEKTVPAEKAIAKANKIKGRKIISPVGKTERKSLLNDKEETQVKKINGHDLKFTNLSKLYWPKEKISKRDLLNYYYQVSPFILPYLNDRPQSMNRHPNGITGKSFYFKDITGKAPSWLETFLYHSESDNRDRHYLVAKDEASLLYMASLGCIEMNPWHSRVKTENYPDWCIIDLDPGKNSFEQVIQAARVTKDVLENMGVKSYPKTSGSTGIHIYIPLGARFTYDQSKEFARVVAKLVSEELPAFTTIERIVKARKGKMYIDFLQNRPQATIAAPYSLRPKPGATVSMPLHWEEVKKGLKMQDFNIYNAMERIKSEGDIFKPVMGKGIDLLKIVNKLST